ncbi:MAG: DUF1566 domain-containing protein [Myxococcaceae bacterium]|nr:DUF1566 domain-containing protein [Myxococcaceae bacterium]MBH2005796.1 DUF1566 domain-containing protein [Myxococcaceae bacterium]
MSKCFSFVLQVFFIFSVFPLSVGAERSILANSNATCSQTNNMSVLGEGIYPAIQTGSAAYCCDWCAENTQCLAAVYNSSGACTLYNSTNFTSKAGHTALLFPGQTCNTVAATDVDPSPGQLPPQSVAALTWQCGENVSALDQPAAESYCSSLGQDWRLPSIWELFELYQQLRVLNGNYIPWAYWSSTSDGPNSVYAWLVNFNDGSMGLDDVGLPYGVRCVR